MTGRSSLGIVLAAGEGARMRSRLPKILHEVGSRPMVVHAMSSARAAGISRLALVVGPGMAAVEKVVIDAGADIVVHQNERLGTAHAVLRAREAIAAGVDDVVVLYGDTPLIRPETIAGVRAELAAGAHVVVLGFQAADPKGYGRLIEVEGRLVAIREERDATDAERAVTFCNSGIMGFSGGEALSILDAIGTNNAKGEYYLTDAVEIADRRGLRVVAVRGAADEFLGANDRRQLAECEAIFQARRRAAALAGGITLIAPETVFFSADTEIAADVTIEPNVVFGPGVRVETGARIRAFSHLEGARVGEGAIVGPFARLRPGADLDRDVHVGNFVEIKNGRIEAGAKVNHLTYIGDARVGAKANIGAGTITCNYDGFGKYRTDIGAGAFVGSNSSLVAPLTIGDGAYIASGSVVTADVPADALVVGRSRQVLREGWAALFRERMRAAKAAK